MSIDYAASTPERQRRALAGADRQIFVDGSPRIRRFSITADQLTGGDVAAQRFILAIVPPGMWVRAQFLVVRNGFSSRGNTTQTITARPQTAPAPANNETTWTNAGSAATIDDSAAKGSNIGGTFGVFSSEYSLAYAILISGTNLSEVTNGRIDVSIVLEPILAVDDSEGLNISSNGPQEAGIAATLTDLSGGGGPIALDDLTDVVITAPTVGDVLTWNGTEYVNLPPGGAPTITAVSVEIDFGTDDTYVSRTVTGQTWVTTNMVFACMVAGDVKSDHDPEDGILEGLVFTVSDVTPGDGFTLHAYAPNGTFGKFNVNVSASIGSGSVVTI